MNCRHLAIASIAIVPLLLAATKAQEWPGFRGPGHDGVARDAKPPTKWSDTENLAWKTELPGPGSSSPIVVGDRIYVTCYTGYGDYLDDGGDPGELVHHLTCIDRAKGKLLWDKEVPGPLAKKARQIQLKEHGFASPTPVTDGKAIYAYFGRAGVAAFDLYGTRLWLRDLGKPSKNAPTATNAVARGGKVLSLRWGSAASPVLHEGVVIVNCSEQSNSIRALDQKTGELVWKHESANLEGCASTPVLVGPKQDRVLVVVLAGAIWALSPTTGKMLWSVATESRGGMCPTPVADDRCVYTFGGSGQSHALRLGKQQQKRAEQVPESMPSRVVWKGENLDVPSPVLHDGLLFLVRTNGMAVCLQAEDGKEVFKGRLGGRTSSVYASPVVADGRLYVVSRKRGTFVYSADARLELLARNELDDKTQFNSSPAIVGNQIFLRSDKYLYCVTPTDPPR
ncbi:MAG: outer membrane protein assembly factor BamB family protein [Planctomycetota bacterium]|jgi:outer membrane protein assembly factor BamB